MSNSEGSELHCCESNMQRRRWGGVLGKFLGFGFWRLRHLLNLCPPSTNIQFGSALRRLLPSVGLLMALLLPFSSFADMKKFPLQLKNGLVQLAELPKDDFKECSGLVVSRQHPGVLWTHNDGRDRRLLAFDRKGEKLAEFELNGMFIFDFEDLAIDDENRLYIADIGNNLHVRPRVTIYRVPEPDPINSGAKLRTEEFWRLEFPKESFDSESIFILKDFGYLISKTHKDKKARLYRWPLSAIGTSTALEEIGKLDVKSPVTGADLSGDGKKLGLVANDGAYVFDLKKGVQSAVDLEPFRLKSKEGQIEGCAFDRDGLLAVAETRELFLFNSKPFVSNPAK